MSNSLHFNAYDHDYNISLILVSGDSKNQIVLEGRKYIILGNQDAIDIFKKKTQGLNLESMKFGQLQNHLSVLENDNTTPSVVKSRNIGEGFLVSEKVNKCVLLTKQDILKKIENCDGSKLAIKKIVSETSEHQENFHLLMDVATTLAKKGEIVKASRLFYVIQLKCTTDEERNIKTLKIGKTFLEYGKKHENVLALDCAQFYISFMNGSNNEYLRSEGKVLTKEIIACLDGISPEGNDVEKQQARNLLDKITIDTLLEKHRGVLFSNETELEAYYKEKHPDVKRAFNLADALQKRIDEEKVPLLKGGGKFIEIEENENPVSIHVKITGERQIKEGKKDPVVILEAGWGCSSADWGFVQNQLPDIQVISYDRVGMSWSDKGDTPTAEKTMERLDKILKVCELEPPYIFVGHSAGGLIAQLYTLKHPDRIAGLVLVESSSENPNTRAPSNQLPTTYDYLPRAAQKRFLQDGGEFLDSNTGTTLQKVTTKSQHMKTLQEESDEFGKTCVLIRETLKEIDSKFPISCPISVITKGFEIFDDSDNNNLNEGLVKEFEEWQLQQLSLSEKSSNGRRVIAEDSDHMVHLHQPSLIADEINKFF